MQNRFCQRMFQDELLESFVHEAVMQEHLTAEVLAEGMSHPAPRPPRLFQRYMYLIWIFILI